MIKNGLKHDGNPLVTQTEVGQVLEAFETFKAIRAEQEEMTRQNATVNI